MRNLNLGTVTEAQRHDLVWNPRNFRKESSRTDVGTTIQTTGDIHLQAGNDLNIITGSASLQRDEASHTKSRGTWGSKRDG